VIFIIRLVCLLSLMNNSGGSGNRRKGGGGGGGKDGGNGRGSGLQVQTPPADSLAGVLGSMPKKTKDLHRTSFLMFLQKVTVSGAYNFEP
jgi:hypothetical protein